MAGRFKFDLGGSATGVEPPRDWLPKDAKDRFDSPVADNVGAYLRGESSCAVVQASKLFYVFNACSWTGGNETFVVSWLRILGWSARLSLYVTAVMFCLVCWTRDPNPIGYYEFSRERNAEGELENDDTDYWEFFVYLVFAIWCISIATTNLTYLTGRMGARPPHEGQMIGFPFALFNRTALPDDGYRVPWAFFLFLWHGALAAAAATLVHTCLAHSFVARNGQFESVLLVLAGCDLLGSVADTVTLGTSEGIGVASWMAAELVALRMLLIVPLNVVFSIFLVLFCNPYY